MLSVCKHRSIGQMKLLNHVPSFCFRSPGVLLCIFHSSMQNLPSGRHLTTLASYCPILAREVPILHLGWSASAWQGGLSRRS